MTNYKSKYIKYKMKYLKIKQKGGMFDEMESIEYDVGITGYYIEELNDDENFDENFKNIEDLEKLKKDMVEAAPNIEEEAAVKYFPNEEFSIKKNADDLKSALIDKHSDQLEKLKELKKKKRRKRKIFTTTSPPYKGKYNI